MNNNNSKRQKTLCPIPPNKWSSYPDFVSTSIPELHDQLYRGIFRSILEIGDFSQVKQMKQEMNPRFSKRRRDFSLDNALESTSHEELLRITREILKSANSRSTCTLYNLDRSGGNGVDEYGLVGDWLGTAISAIVIIYSLSPVFILMEMEVGKKVRAGIGYDKDGNGDGMIVPGAAAGNGYAMQVALQKKFPHWKRLGNSGLAGGRSPVMFVSAHANFQHEIYCQWEGLGEGACRRVKVDRNGRMDVQDLEVQIIEAQAQGFEPFLIVATAGTEILGSIDPIDRISEIAAEYTLHLHVDGGLAGSNFLSANHRHRLQGIEKSHSFLWNLERLCAPKASCVLVTRESGVMKKTFGYDAPYVFARGGLYDNQKFDNGDSTLQCSRRPEILKIWLMWKAKGQKGLAGQVDSAYKLTASVISEIKTRQRTSRSFHLITRKVDSCQLAFYYIPKSLRGFPKSRVERILKKSRFTETLQKNLEEAGVMSISVENLPGVKTPFFVMNLSNARQLNEFKVSNLLDEIEFYGEDLGKHFWDVLRPVQENRIQNSYHDYSEKNSEILKKHGSTLTTDSDHSQSRQFLARFLEFIRTELTYMEDERDGDRVLPLNFLTPENLVREFDFNLNDQGVKSEAGFFEIIRNINKYSAHFSHPFFNYTLSQGYDPYSLMADYIVPVVNCPSKPEKPEHPMTLMEQELTRAVRKLVGYPGENGDGLVVPGGSAAIQLAMAMARKQKEKIVANNFGELPGNPTFVAFVSSGGHWATSKGAFFMGIGLENCIQIETEPETGRMCARALRSAVLKSLDQGHTPFFVTATSGSTVFGSWDPLNEIADICEEFRMWMHVDGSYGGPTLMSSNPQLRREKLMDVERSDSFNLNAHKVLGVVRESSILVTKRPNVMGQFSNAFADGRSGVFKLWFTWKAKGLLNLGRHVDYGYELTAKAAEEIESRGDAFRLAGPPQSTHINFQFIPPRLRHLVNESKADCSELSHELETVTHEIVRKMTEGKKVLLATKKPAGSNSTYLVLACAHSALSFEDVQYLLDMVQFYGADL